MSENHNLLTKEGGDRIEQHLSDKLGMCREAMLSKIMHNKEDLEDFRNNLTALLAERKQYFLTQLDNIEKATDLARGQMETRLAGMNEFRDALKDQRADQITREYFETSIQAIKAERAIVVAALRKDIDDLETAIDTLNTYKATMEGKASQSSVLIFGGISIVSFVLTVIKFFQ